MVKEYGADVVPNVGYYFLLTLFVMYFTFALVNLIKQRKNVTEKRVRNQIDLILIGFFISAALTVATNLVLVLAGSSELGFLGPPSLLIFVSMSVVAILKHQLFDIRIIIRRVFIYTVLLALIFGAYSTVIFVTSSLLPINKTVGDFFAALLVAFGFEPTRRWLQIITEKYLFIYDYNADTEIRQLTQSLNNVIDLDEALRLVMAQVVEAMRITRAAALVLAPDERKGIVVKRIQEVNFPSSGRLMTDQYLPIVQYFQKTPQIKLVLEMDQEIIDSETSSKRLKAIVDKDQHNELISQNVTLAQKKEVSSLLQRLKIAMVVPIVVKGKLIGILYFGEKLSGGSFYEDDINFLTTVGAQTGSAIEKARFYEEDQLKSEFVSIASHELLTPTAAIEGYLSMILDEKLAKVDPKAEEYLQKVYVSAKRLSKLVKDLLSVSRIEAGRIKIEPQKFDLVEVVQQQIDQLNIKAQEAKLKLVYNRPKNPAMVFADPERVAQAVVNLVGNAIKYTKEGSVTVNITDKQRHFEVEVIDTGMGIKPEDREHLFEKFHRVNTTQTTGIIGTGLGLYITKSIIELMKGVVTVKSTFGKGSTFAFTLPKG